MKRSAIGLIFGILSCLLFPWAQYTLFGLHMGVYLVAFSLIGFYFAYIDTESKGLKTATQIVCILSAIMNFISVICAFRYV